MLPPKSEKHARNAVIISIVAVSVAVAALIGLVWAVSANALTEEPPSPVVAETWPALYDGALASAGNDAAVAEWYRAAEQARIDRLWARWGPVNICEQGGNWYAAGSTHVGYFEGGLGILASLYRSIAGHSALQDSPIQQMEVADIALSIHGRGAWGCPVG